MSRRAISVVIPAYNAARFLPTAIESALSQTRPVDEVVVVDDGSQDETAAVAARFGPPVRCIWQENRGLSGARNAGIQAATGDWVALLDADDWWLPAKIERQCAALDVDPRASLCYTSYWLQDAASGRRILCSPPPADHLMPRLRYLNDLAGGSTILVRRQTLLDVGGFDESLRACEDHDMWLRLVAHGQRFCFSPEPLTVILTHESSLSQDPELMLRNMERILETTLLFGLEGWQRSTWRRKIRSTVLFQAAISARKLGRAAERTYLIRSFQQWPSPFFDQRRWKALLLNYFRR